MKNEEWGGGRKCEGRGGDDVLTFDCLIFDRQKEITTNKKNIDYV